MQENDNMRIFSLGYTFFVILTLKKSRQRGISVNNNKLGVFLFTKNHFSWGAIQSVVDSLNHVFKLNLRVCFLC